MAKIRAYKLAEELGLDKEDFLKKAAELGVQLRSHMVGIDEEDAETLRRRMGGAAARQTEERRVTDGGKVIIRRRKKRVEPKREAPPEPTVTAEPAQVAEEPAAAGDAEPAQVDAPAVDAEPGVAPAPDEVEPLAASAQPESEGEPATVSPASSPAQPASPGEGQVAAAAEDRVVPRTAPGLDDRETALPTGGGGSAAARKGPRRTVQEMNLKDQESMARTMLGNVQRRLEQRRLIVERQSRINPSRRVRTVRTGRSSRSMQPTAVGKTPAVVKLPTSEVSFVELARQSGVKARDLWRRTRQLGLDCDRDEKIDLETAQLLGTEFGFEVKLVLSEIEEVEAAIAEGKPENDAEMIERPPVVTVMGHVDHGKTSLLDYIRKANVVAGEAGGITQHIGAYTARSGDAQITFIDTPGHAAFSAMRARGAQITDIVVLVVAADDGVMPQTLEAINHAKAAAVPIIVAVNKIDLPDANPSRVKQALLEHDLVVEDFGGDVISVEVSATKGTGIDKLLEMLALQAEILELKASPKGKARGHVVEAQLEKGRGAVATVLVEQGTLKRGDAVVAGNVSGRVRTMTDHNQKQLKQATPSIPVQITGLSGVPEAGAELVAVKNEREAKALVEHRMAEERRAAMEASSEPKLEDIFGSLGEDDEKELRLVVKADVGGTLEAVREGVEALSNPRVSIKVIHTGVGAINESDITLASASDAVVLGFHVRPEPTARRAAEKAGVEIRYYDIVYELFDEVKALMTGLLPPKVVETVSGHAQVRNLFVVPRVGTIAGCYVPEGTIKRSSQIRVLRDGVMVYTGRIDSLRRFKENVREVNGPIECGIHVENFNDVKVGDELEAFEIEERPDTL